MFGVSRKILWVRCLKWHQIDTDFSNEIIEYSDGWICDTLKRNGFTSLKLHGEAYEMAPEQESESMIPWILKLHSLLEEEYSLPECF